MGQKPATVVVRSVCLFVKRPSLMAENSYRVVCDIGSGGDQRGSGLSDEPKL
jgi:hypothetical protein